MTKILLLFIALGFSCKADAFIEETDIGGINPETTGVSSYDTKFVPLDLWAELSHSEIIKLVRNLPTNFKNTFWPRLQISLLLAPMKIPENKTGKNNLFALRFEKLLEMEAIDQAYSLGKNHTEQLDKNMWDWCRFLRFMMHNNYDKAFSVAQENAVKDEDNRWQYAVITMQLLMDKEAQANLSLSLLEKENKKQDYPFVESIKKIQAGKKVNAVGVFYHPLIMKLMVSKNNVPDNFDIESLSDGMLLLMILDPGFEKFSDRMKLSILEYYVEQNADKAKMLQDHYLKIAKEDQVKDVAEKLAEKEYNMENDPLIRAAYYKVFTESEDEEIKKTAFYAFYKNAYANKILSVARGCFGKDYNYPASSYDKDYAFAFVLHNLMLGDASSVKAWMEGLAEDELRELSLLILATFDLGDFSGDMQKKLQENVEKLKLDPAQKFLFKEKLEFLQDHNYSLKLSDYRLVDVISGKYGFGKSLCILLHSSKDILETDIWQAAIQVRALSALGLIQQAKQLRQHYAYPTPKEA